MTEDKDNSWMYLAIFAIAYMGFFALMAIIDEPLLNHAYGKFLCDNLGYIGESGKQWCIIIGANVK